VPVTDEALAHWADGPVDEKRKLFNYRLHVFNSRDRKFLIWLPATVGDNDAMEYVLLHAMKNTDIT
jgi:hypothetical protein